MTAAPVTPAPRVQEGGEVPLQGQSFDAGAEELIEPKEELPNEETFVNEVGDVIEVMSDTDSSASESASDGCSTDAEQELQPDDEVPALGHELNFALKVQKVKTRIIRETKGRYLFDVKDSASFDQDVKGTQTSCGRIDDEKFKLIQLETDWTHRCRVCFQGRRDPRVGV